MDLEDLLALGLGYAIKEKWEEIDNKVIPEYRSKLHEMYNPAKKTEDFFDAKLHENFSSSIAEVNVLDYEATICATLFKDYFRKGRCVSEVEAGKKLVEFLLKMLSNRRRGEYKFAEFRAALALIEAKRAGFEVLIDGEILKDAIKTAIESEEELEELAKPYLEYLNGD